ncbi:MAG: hypothetical protein ACFFB2_16870 [Promethearchaeota archaeon]
MASTSQTNENGELNDHSKPFILPLALILAFIFTLAFYYVVDELPKSINRILKDFFPDYSIGSTEQMTSFENLLRPIGYMCFFGVLILIFLGFLSKRFKLTFLGSLTFYLPIFGHFAATMFLFAGIGVLRIFWMPLLESSLFSIDLLKLGEVVLLPYYLLKEIISDLGGGNPSFISKFAFNFSNSMIGLGILIFLFSTMTWIYGRYTSQTLLLDLWIYKYSRHPQYLGLLVWSYGLLVQVGSLSYPKGGYVPTPSLPWVIFIFIIIGVALQEELNLLEEFPDAYTAYCQKTSFILPLPKLITISITKMNSFFLRKARPERGKDIILILGVYFGILTILSFFLLYLSQ